MPVLSKIASALSGVNKVDKFLLLGGSGLAYIGMKKGFNFLGGGVLGRPGTEVSDPVAAMSPHPWAQPIHPYLSKAPTSGLMNSFNVLMRPNRSEFPEVGKFFAKPIAATAAVTGVTAGLIAAAATRKLGPSVGAAIAGGIGGGTLGFKLAAGLSKSLNYVSQVYYGVNRPAMDYRAYGGGQGFRTWYKKPGGRMSPGHMGADGTLPLALHKVRNRSLRT